MIFLKSIVKHKIFVLSAYVLTIVTIRCSSPSTPGSEVIADYDEVQRIDIGQPVLAQKLSNFLKIKALIPLEYSEQSVLQNVSNIFPCKEGFIIVHHQSAEVKLFSYQGKYIRDIGRIGKGPGEYIFLFDSDYLPQNSELLLYGRTKLIRYKLEQYPYQHKDEAPGFSSFYFDAWSPSLYGFHMNNGFSDVSGAYNFVATDDRYSVLARGLPAPANDGAPSYADSGFLTEGDGGFVFNNPYSDSVFHYNAQTSSLQLRYLLDFGVSRKETSPDDPDFMKVKNQEGYLMSNYTEDSEIFAFRCVYEKRYRAAIWLREQQVLLSEKSFDNNSLLLHLFPPKGRTKDGLYIGAIVPGWYYSNIPNDDPDFLPFLQENYPQLYEVSKDLDGSENPILVLYEIHPEGAAAALNQK